MKPDLKWSPKVNIVENFDYSRNAARLHFEETTKCYQKQYCVNLIDKKGSQDRIGKEFNKLITDIKDETI